VRIGVIGLGSMGRRRARDLSALGHSVIGHDLRADREAAAATDFGIAIASGLDALLDDGLDGVVISTPPDEHAALYERALAAGLSFFSEANVLTPRAEWLAAAAATADPDRPAPRGYASATWRFYPPFVALRAELAGREVRSVHHAYAGWLPAWHPWEPYDAFYAGARRGTCAAREMVPFELEWLTWIFGPVAEVSALHGARATWTTDIDDTYLLQLAFASGVVGSLAVELHALAPHRQARISCEGTGYLVDVAAHELRRFDHGSGGWTVLAGGPLSFEDVYRDEIAAFAAALDGAPYPKAWSEDRHLSDILVAAEESARRGERIVVADVAGAYDGLDPEPVLDLETARA
jgi:predicted dehydrogenase